MLVGVIGYKGSGKGSIARVLCDDHNFFQESFAGPVKDVASVIFRWPRDLLEGDTAASREFREKKDEFWSKALGYPITPRLALQKIGTEGGRDIFGYSLWTAALEARLAKGLNYVISDVRFSNELEALQRLGAVMVRVTRGAEPEWAYTLQHHKFTDQQAKQFMGFEYPLVHASEWNIARLKHDYLIENNGTIQELNEKVFAFIKQMEHQNALE